MVIASTVRYTHRYIQHNVEHGDASYMRSFPHVVLQGVNHCQYVTGQRPDRVVRFWIESDLDTMESCDLVANVTLPFVEMLTSVCIMTVLPCNVKTQ